MSIFEAGMLFCFGLAWPISIVRTWRSRSTKGKSPVFSVVIIIGYLCGTIHKLLYSYDIVMVLYLINMIMVTIDLGLWLRNAHLERQEHKAANI
jgi:hypothetical protein